MSSTKVKRILEQIKAKPSEDDPVLDGLIREFKKFGESLKALYDGVGKFTQALDQQCHGTMSMVETFSTTLSRAGHYIASDMVKYKEACNNITREDAPFSTIAKFKRDLNFNVIEPLRKHIGHYHVLLDRIERRHRLLAELKVCRQALEGQIEDNTDKLTKSDFDKVASLFNEFKTAKKLFEKENTNLLEWMLMIDAYQEDIYDSLIQTIKCLQYEFLAGSARNIASVLPKTMEFRPLMEMTPENLLPQVQIAMMAREEKVKAKGLDHSKLQTTTRILELFQSDSDHESDIPLPSNRSVQVDPLSLSLLLAQGFDEELARRALRSSNNDTQAALDWLLNPPPEGETTPPTLGDVTTSVRLPKTGKLMEKLRAYEEARRARLAKQNESEIETANSTDTDDAMRTLKEVIVENLLSEATPQQKKKRSRVRRARRSSSDSHSEAADEKSSSSSSSESSRERSIDSKREKKHPAKSTSRHNVTTTEPTSHKSTGNRRSGKAERRHRSLRRGKGRHRSEHASSRSASVEKDAQSKQEKLISSSSSRSASPADRRSRNHSRANGKRTDEEAASVRRRIPRRSRQRSPEANKGLNVAASSKSEMRVFEPSPLPLMLAELLPIGGGLSDASGASPVIAASVEGDEVTQPLEVKGRKSNGENDVPLEEFRDLLFETSSSSSSMSHDSIRG